MILCGKFCIYVSFQWYSLESALKVKKVTTKEVNDFIKKSSGTAGIYHQRHLETEQM